MEPKKLTARRSAAQGARDNNVFLKRYKEVFSLIKGLKEGIITKLEQICSLKPHPLPATWIYRAVWIQVSQTFSTLVPFQKASLSYCWLCSFGLSSPIHAIFTYDLLGISWDPQRAIQCLVEKCWMSTSREVQERRGGCRQEEEEKTSTQFQETFMATL